MLRERILEALGDPDTPKILLLIRRLPKSAQMLSDETTIPISSIYRKMATLRSAGLVHVRSYEITSEGKRQDLFLSSVTEVRVGMGNEEVELELIPTEESASRIWFELFNK